MLVKGTKGILACGYLNPAAFDKTREAAAIVSGVKTFDDMLGAKVVAVSKAGIKLGMAEGLLGKEVLERIR